MVDDESVSCQATVRHERAVRWLWRSGRQESWMRTRTAGVRMDAVTILGSTHKLRGPRRLFRLDRDRACMSLVSYKTLRSI